MESLQSKCCYRRRGFLGVSVGEIRKLDAEASACFCDSNKLKDKLVKIGLADRDEVTLRSALIITIKWTSSLRSEFVARGYAMYSMARSFLKLALLLNGGGGTSVDFVAAFPGDTGG